MRISGGQARSIPIKAPPKGDVRPATDYLREAVFSSLGPGQIAEATVLDCFCGTGAYGLEALSRGAKFAHFIEQNRTAIKYWQSNLAAVAKALQVEPKSVGELRSGDFFAIIKRVVDGPTFDLIFVDPPYPLWNERGTEILALLANCLSPGGRIVAEAPGSYEPGPLPGLQCARRLAKGPRQPSALIFAHDH